MGTGYLVITTKGGGYFKEYSPNIKKQFYTHIEPTYKKAIQSVRYFKKRGIHAKIYRNFLTDKR